ncbi:MAG: hypothetical protein COB85_06395, partial [Bacteroidetes bacterium]
MKKSVVLFLANILLFHFSHAQTDSILELDSSILLQSPPVLQNSQTSLITSLPGTHTHVLGVRPPHSSFLADPRTDITVTFNNPIETATINDTGSFKVVGEISGIHRGSFVYSQLNEVVTFIPEVPFLKSEVVRVFLSNQIKDDTNDTIHTFTSQFTIAIDPSPAKFEPAVTYSAGLRPLNIIVADLDADGDGDIVVPNSGKQLVAISRTVSVYMNNGDGTFAPQVTYDTDTQTGNLAPSGVCAADIDSDGDLDLLVANAIGKVSVLRNNGNGIFGTAESYFVGDGPTRIKAFDLDLDGDNDLIVTASGSLVFVLMNNGDGTFASRIRYFAGSCTWGLSVYDIDNDGDGDIITANFCSSDISVLFNRGDGTFTAPSRYTVGSVPRDLYIADLDNDGDGDIVSANQFSRSVTLWFNNGDGTFANRTDYLVKGQPVGIFISDIDGDEDMDVITANHFGGGSNTVSIWHNRGDGVLTTREDFLAGFQPIDVFVSDLDGDGDGDLATANWSANYFTVLKNSVPGITGVKFEDLNGNGVRDTNDLGLKDFLIEMEGGAEAQYATTNRLGEYYFVTEPGTYGVREIQQFPFEQTFPPAPGTHQFTLTAGEERADVDFGNQLPLLSVPDLCVSISGTQDASFGNCDPVDGYDLEAYCDACCADQACLDANPQIVCPPDVGNICPNCVNRNYQITFSNEGAALVDPCTLTVTLPPGILPDYLNITSVCDPGVNFTNAPDLVSGDIAMGFTLEWFNICDPNLPANKGCTLLIEAQVACCIAFGTTLTPECVSFTSVGDADLDACPNTDCEPPFEYTGPIDPNNKLLVFPKGLGPCNEVQPTDTLTYLVNFQNIGTAPARNVVIIDTLDFVDLDVTSVQTLQTSHEAELTISGPGILKWTFKDIFLPDSASDPQGSNGYVKFSVRPRSDVESGALIENTAGIFFDFNPPVITNTVVSKIAGDSLKMANFTSSSELCVIPYDFAFDYAGGEQSVSLLWDFGVDATPAASTENNLAGVTYSTSGNKIITLTATTGECFVTKVDTITVPVTIPLPIATITPNADTGICPGDTISLIADIAAAYLWSTGATTQSIPVAGPGSFSVITFNINGCSDTSDVVEVDFLLVPSIDAGPDVEVCIGDSVQLSATGAEDPEQTICIVRDNCLSLTNNLCKDGFARYTGTATSPSFRSFGAPSVKEIEFKVWFTNCGTIQLPTWTFFLNGVQIGSAPKILNIDCRCKPSSSNYPRTYTVTGPIIDSLFNFGSINTLGIGNNEDVTAIAGLSGVIKYASYPYSWSPVDGLSDPNVANPKASPALTTTYTASITDASGCVSKDDVLVSVFGICGNNNDKVQVCHVFQGNQQNLYNPGNPETLCVDKSSKAFHLAHGDFCGPCSGLKWGGPSSSDPSNELNKDVDLKDFESASLGQPANTIEIF